MIGKRRIVMLFLTLGLCAGKVNAQETITLLPTKAEGAWPCYYYFLNKNEEINDIATKEWTSRCTDESDWIDGYGPLSNSYDQFLTSYWGSERLPLLVRRHFTLTADDLEAIGKGSVELTCSYDENPKMYLNGTLVWQATGWNDNEYTRRVLSPRQKQLFKEGDNVLAVSLTAGGGGGHIDYGLTLVRHDDPTAIKETGREKTQRTLVYDLRGVRRQGMADAHGVNIVNNRKIINKQP